MMIEIRSAEADSDRRPLRTRCALFLAGITLVGVLAACSMSDPVMTRSSADGDLTQPPEQLPQTALSMGRPLEVPPSVIEAVRPEGFDAQGKSPLTPGEGFEPTIVNRTEDPVLDAAITELDSSNIVSLSPPPDIGEGIRGQYGIHLTSYRDRENVMPGVVELAERYGRELQGLSARVNAESVAGRGMFYRLKFGPFASRSSADARCESLRMRGAYCSVVQFDGDPL